MIDNTLAHTLVVRNIHGEAFREALQEANAETIRHALSVGSLGRWTPQTKTLTLREQPLAARLKELEKTMPTKARPNLADSVSRETPAKAKPAKAKKPALLATEPMPSSGDAAPATAPVLRIVNPKSIEANPWQPRRSFDEDEMASLAESIKETGGPLQPPVVREHPQWQPGTTYQLIAGERRVRASIQAEIEEIRILVRPATDREMAELAIVENRDRADINPIDEALAYKRLQDEFGATAAEVGDRAGKSRSAIANSLRLLKLPESVREMVLKNELNASHARALLRWDEYPAFIEWYAPIIVREQISSKLVERGLPQWVPTTSEMFLARGHVLFEDEDDWITEKGPTWAKAYPGAFVALFYEGSDEDEYFCLDANLLARLASEADDEQERLRLARADQDELEREEREAQALEAAGAAVTAEPTAQASPQVLEDAETPASTSSTDASTDAQAEPLPAAGTPIQRAVAQQIPEVAAALAERRPVNLQKMLSHENYKYLGAHPSFPQGCSPECECLMKGASAGYGGEVYICIDPKRHVSLQRRETIDKNKAQRELLAKRHAAVLNVMSRAMASGDELRAVVALLATLNHGGHDFLKASLERHKIPLDAGKVTSGDAKYLLKQLNENNIGMFELMIAVTESMLLHEIAPVYRDAFDSTPKATRLLKSLNVDEKTFEPSERKLVEGKSP